MSASGQLSKVLSIAEMMDPTNERDALVLEMLRDLELSLTHISALDEHLWAVGNSGVAS